jgi:catechol 2,3-dioxygenase-like lactoylglutathione lyase family enzyme
MDWRAFPKAAGRRSGHNFAMLALEMAMAFIQGIDHVAITVFDIDRSTRFYEQLFQATVVAEHAPDGQVLVRQLSLGGANLSIHQAGNGVALVAEMPTPGSADICFRWASGIDSAVAHLVAHGIQLLENPSPRTTADGKRAMSVFFKDDSGNLIELMAVG